MFKRGTERLPVPQRERARRVGNRIAEVVRSYVSVNLVLAAAAGLLTFLFLEIEGFHLAIAMAVLVAFFDLIPLIGLTMGGAVVAIVLLIDGGPGDALVWAAVFLVYQQLQDRMIQPLMYKGGALKVNPAVAIVAMIVGAELAGVLGALLGDTHRRIARRDPGRARALRRRRRRRPTLSPSRRPTEASRPAGGPCAAGAFRGAPIALRIFLSR